MGKLRSYLLRVLIAGDVFLNVVFGGMVGETISARSQRAADRGNWLGRFMIWWLNKIQRDHGIGAVRGDMTRADQVEDIEAEYLKVDPP